MSLNRSPLCTGECKIQPLMAICLSVVDSRNSDTAHVERKRKVIKSSAARQIAVEQGGAAKKKKPNPLWPKSFNSVPQYAHITVCTPFAKGKYDLVKPADGIERYLAGGSSRET